MFVVAIGSAPEIGARFGLLRDMTPQDLDAWFVFMRENWHPNLLNGYATVVTYAEMKARRLARES